jgi:hypothetical protein
MRFDFHGASPFINNDGAWPFSFRAKGLVPGNLTRREWLRIESRFHIRFDFHDLSPFLIFETNAQALRSTASEAKGSVLRKLARREGLRIDSRSYICFDSHVLSPSAVTRSKAEAKLSLGKTSVPTLP